MNTTNLPLVKQSGKSYPIPFEVWFNFDISVDGMLLNPDRKAEKEAFERGENPMTEIIFEVPKV